MISHDIAEILQRGFVGDLDVLVKGGTERGLAGQWFRPFLAELLHSDTRYSSLGDSSI